MDFVVFHVLDLCNSMIVTAIEKKDHQPPAYSMPLLEAMVAESDEESEEGEQSV